MAKDLRQHGRIRPAVVGCHLPGAAAAKLAPRIGVDPGTAGALAAGGTLGTLTAPDAYEQAYQVALAQGKPPEEARRIAMLNAVGRAVTETGMTVGMPGAEHQLFSRTGRTALRDIPAAALKLAAGEAGQEGATEYADIIREALLGIKQEARPMTWPGSVSPAPRVR